MSEEHKLYPIGGYAPGTYMCKCCTCLREFFGDKRAVQCETCAVKTEFTFLRKQTQTLQAEIFSFRKKLYEPNLRLLKLPELIKEFDKHFHITTQRHGNTTE